MTNQNAIPGNVSLYPDDWAVVKKVAHTKDNLFDGNVSQALRYIIRDWAKTQRQRAGLRTPLPQPADDVAILT